MRRTQGERTSPLCLMKRQQDCCDRVAGVSGFLMGFEAVAEVPRLVVKRRVAPGKEFNDAVPQNEIVVITCAWHPALGLRRGHLFPLIRMPSRRIISLEQRRCDNIYPPLDFFEHLREPR